MTKKAKKSARDRRQYSAEFKAEAVGQPERRRLSRRAGGGCPGRRVRLGASGGLGRRPRSSRSSPPACPTGTRDARVGRTALSAVLFRGIRHQSPVLRGGGRNLHDAGDRNSPIRMAMKRKTSGARGRAPARLPAKPSRHTQPTGPANRGKVETGAPRGPGPLRTRPLFRLLDRCAMGRTHGIPHEDHTVI